MHDARATQQVAISKYQVKYTSNKKGTTYILPTLFLPHTCSIATTHTVEEMEQQEGKWFLNNLRAMIQDELK